MSAKTMAEVLAEHQLFDSWWSAEKGAELKCMCMVVASYDDLTETDHEAHGKHQADALTAAGFGLVADAKAEALEEAAEAIKSERPEMGPGININQYREGRNDAFTTAVAICTARAAAVTCGE